MTQRGGVTTLRLEPGVSVMPFRSRLQVVHIDGERWCLTRPLVWEGRWEWYVIRSEFETDFASIPKPVRWLLDSSGRNSEAAVLHDAVWRESQRKVGARVDPWNADGMFRRALRETGTPALTRGLMWFAVRLTAMVKGRFGKQGPRLGTKLLQLLGILVIGMLAALAPTAVALAGLAVYAVFNWLAALAWWPFEKYRLGEPTNWPWPAPARVGAADVKAPPARELLLIIAKTDPVADRLADLVSRNPEPSDTDLELLLASQNPPLARRVAPDGTASPGASYSAGAPLREEGTHP